MASQVVDPDKYQEGVKAAQAGKTAAVCKYSTKSPYGRSWMKGYKSVNTFVSKETVANVSNGYNAPEVMVESKQDGSVQEVAKPKRAYTRKATNFSYTKEPVRTVEHSQVEPKRNDPAKLTKTAKQAIEISTKIIETIITTTYGTVKSGNRKIKMESVYYHLESALSYFI